MIAPGDRSHIPSASQPIFEILSRDMQRVKSRAPQNFMPQVLDTEKRLNILFDHLNNEDLLKADTIAEMSELAQHLQARNYEQAQVLFTDLMTNKNDEGSNWMVSSFNQHISLYARSTNTELGWSEASDSDEPGNTSMSAQYPNGSANSILLRNVKGMLCLPAPVLLAYP